MDERHHERIDRTQIQIDELLKVIQRGEDETAELRRSIVELRRSNAETERLWQAYLKRLPPQ